MNPESTIKKIAKNALRFYLASYLAVSLHIAYDSANDPLIRNPPSQLEIREYRIKIKNKEKLLTLVGEIHHYNRTESEIAKKLVDKHHNFADECGSKGLQKISLGERLYATMIGFPYMIEKFFTTVPTGRYFPSLSDIVEQKGHKNYPLENYPLETVGFLDRTLMLCESLGRAFIAPILYYTEKDDLVNGLSEAEFKKKFEKFPYRESLIDKRDPKLARGIIEILEKDEINDLLAVVGKAHLEGITKYLTEKIELEKAQ